MTGFIRGLFRAKQKADPTEPAVTETPQPQPKPGAYYLPPDEAKTFGNLDYMRSSKPIRRTFSKKKVGEDNEVIRSVSAMEMQKAARNGKTAPMQPMPTTTATPSANGATPAAKPAEPPANTERRRADDSLELFRNMARDLKKR